jgi:outer membrane protein
MKTHKLNTIAVTRPLLGALLVAVAALAACTVLILGAAPALAADFKMGVLDPQEVLEKSKAGKRSLDALKEYARTRQKVLASDEDELKTFEKSLKDQEATLNEQQKREKQEVFRAKIQAYQKRAQDFNQDLAGKQKEMVDDYMKRIAAATKNVAEKGGFSLVVDKGSEQTLRIVIYNKDTIDITNDVIKEFDRLNPVK